MSKQIKKVEVKTEPSVDVPKVKASTEKVEASAEVVMPEAKKITNIMPKSVDGYKSVPVTHIPRQYTRKGYKALIEAYKKQNPVKYEQKKSSLNNRLRRLK